MTVIAWDGKSLAGDRMADYGGTKRRVRKVFKIKMRDYAETWLVGASGSMALVQAWLEWLKGGEKPNIPPESSFTAIMIDPQGCCWQMEHSLAKWRVRESFHAIGGGRGEALGAMAMGADARQAVLVSARFDSGVGLGVDVVSLGRNGTKQNPK